MTLTENIFNRLLTGYTVAKGKFSRIINTNPSRTTESCYIMFVTTQDEVYLLALSDHIASGHDLEIDEEFDDDNETSPLSEVDWEYLQGRLSSWFTDEIRDGDMTEPRNVDWEEFGITKARYYHDQQALIGRYVPERAFIASEVDDTIRIQAAHLSHHKQVLSIIYQDMNDEHEDTERYINHLPGWGDTVDIATIYYLMQVVGLSAHDARRLFYSADYGWELNDKLSWLAESSLLEGIDTSSSDGRGHKEWAKLSIEEICPTLPHNEYDTYRFLGKEYVADLADLHQQMVHNDIE